MQDHIDRKYLIWNLNSQISGSKTHTLSNTPMLDCVEMSEVVRKAKEKAEWVEFISHSHFNQSTCFITFKKITILLYHVLVWEFDIKKEFSHGSIMCSDRLVSLKMKNLPWLA